MEEKGNTQKRDDRQKKEVKPKKDVRQENIKGKGEADEKEEIRLDRIMKMLFEVSKPLMIRIINYFFNEDYDVNQDYRIEFTNKESVSKDLELSIADLVIEVETVPRFHFEFQLNRDSMALRMFEYGYREALKTINEKERVKTLFFPKQVVLYLEEGKGAPDDLELKVVFPITDKGAQTVIYRILVKKVWEIGKEEKIRNGLYTLLPLELFRLRRQVEKTRTADEEEYSRLSNEIKTATIEIAKTTMRLREKGKITEEDCVKIINATGYLFVYFSNNYADLRLRREVPEVLESLCDKYRDIGKQEGIQEGKQEGILLSAKKLLKNGMALDLVCRMLELSEETVDELKKGIKN